MRDRTRAIATTTYGWSAPHNPSRPRRGFHMLRPSIPNRPFLKALLDVRYPPTMFLPLQSIREVNDNQLQTLPPNIFATLGSLEEL